jgi:hypothetical protein
MTAPLRLDRHGEVFETPALGECLAAFLEALEAHCPDYDEPGRWQQPVDDGHRVFAEWGDRAEALGWTPVDVFGLPDIPTGPTHRRPSRVDAVGLAWLLHGRAVVDVTAERATIATQGGGAVTFIGAI